METTIVDPINDSNVQINVRKFTANDGTEFIGFTINGLNHVAIDLFNGDSDLITEFESCNTGSITFISNDRNYTGDTLNGITYFTLNCRTSRDFV